MVRALTKFVADPGYPRFVEVALAPPLGGRRAFSEEATP
jgi:hypothetical protein